MAWNKYPECRPAEEKNYLCCLIGGHVTYLTWTGYAFSGMVNERITHWQPIVSPQEEEQRHVAHQEAGWDICETRIGLPQPCGDYEPIGSVRGEDGYTWIQWGRRVK